MSIHEHRQRMTCLVWKEVAASFWVQTRDWCSCIVDICKRNPDVPDVTRSFQSTNASKSFFRQCSENPWLDKLISIKPSFMVCNLLNHFSNLSGDDQQRSLITSIDKAMKLMAAQERLYLRYPQQVIRVIKTNDNWASGKSATNAPVKVWMALISKPCSVYSTFLALPYIVKLHFCLYILRLNNHHSIPRDLRGSNLFHRPEGSFLEVSFLASWTRQMFLPLNPPSLAFVAEFQMLDLTFRWECIVVVLLRCPYSV